MPAVNIKSGKNHTFSGPSQFVSVTNTSLKTAKFKFSYNNANTQKHTLGGDATQNYPQPEWPVKVTNTGKVTISVGTG